jgi:alkanesulfonate monooxygenase SsuD/methylene tetrahydromethanopterin reductase-like flavin-dependent oxidoreductase (luciferase family)
VSDQGRPPLRVGVQVNTVQQPFRFEEVRSLAIAAEAAGLDSVWTEDHLLQAYGDRILAPWESLSVMAALAEVTERVQLGTQVVATVFRNPAMLAKQAVTIDEISQGRFILGVGTGYGELELKAYGMPTDRLVSRFEEAFSILHRLVRGERVTFEGTYYTVRDCYILPSGPRSTGPELMAGTDSPRMLGITLPHVDGVNQWWAWPKFQNRPDKFAELQKEVDATAEAVGRDPREVWRSAAAFVQLDGAIGLPIPRLPDGVEPFTGGASALADWFNAFADAGAEHLVLLLDPPTPAAVDTVGRALEILRAS